MAIFHAPQVEHYSVVSKNWRAVLAVVAAHRAKLTSAVLPAKYDFGAGERMNRPNEGAIGMARKTVLVSDISGDEIEEGKAATVTIKFDESRKGTIVKDCAPAEAEAMGAKGRKQARRGRRPKNQAA